jgi:hypothetical protein
MRSYERNGVTVDQCTGCRGVFLDRGELERLVDAEGAYYDRAESQPPRDSAPRREERVEQHRSRDDWRPGYGHAHGKRKKKSFLDDIFDFG